MKHHSEQVASWLSTGISTPPDVFRWNIPLSWHMSEAELLQLFLSAYDEALLSTFLQELHSGLVTIYKFDLQDAFFKEAVILLDLAQKEEEGGPPIPETEFQYLVEIVILFLRRKHLQSAQIQ